MKARRFLQLPDDRAIDAIESGDLDDDALLDAAVWQRVWRLRISIGSELHAQLTKRRANRYRKHPDHVILIDIQLLAVPDEVLIDKEGWARVCQVFKRNQAEVDSGTWAELCTKRGRIGVPPGPYRRTDYGTAHGE